VVPVVVHQKKRGKKQKSVQPAKPKQPTKAKIKATDSANYYSPTAPDFTLWSCAKQVQAGTLEVRRCFFLKALSVDKNNFLSRLRLAEMDENFYRGGILQAFTFYWNLSHHCDITEHLRSFAKYKCLLKNGSYLGASYVDPLEEAVDRTSYWSAVSGNEKAMLQQLGPIMNAMHAEHNCSCDLLFCNENQTRP
jgi:hypothetical protein